MLQSKLTCLFRLIFAVVIFSLIHVQTLAQKIVVRPFKKGFDTIEVHGNLKEIYWIHESTLSPEYKPKQYWQDSMSKGSGRITGFNDPKHSTYIKYQNNSIYLDLEGKRAAHGATYFCITNQTKKRVNANVELAESDASVRGNFKTVILNNMWGMPNISGDRYFVEALDADTLKSYNPKLLEIQNSYVRYLNYANFNSSRLVVTDSKIDNLRMGGYLPDSLAFYNVDFSGVKGQADLTNYNPQKRTIIFIKDIDIKKLNINLGRTYVIPVYEQSYENKLAAFEELVKRCNDGGYLEQAEMYDKALQSLKYQYNNHPIIDFISKIWWDYGYEKDRIIYISIGLFFAFTLLNFVVAKHLREVYWPDRFQEFDARLNEHYVDVHRRTRLKRHVKHSFGILLFTGFIFWGVRFDLKEMQLRHRWIVLLLVTEYVIGIICLAYIANFVISK